MEIFGFELQEFIFSIFLPFLFFYLLLYALLTKTKILTDSTSINSLTALTLSSLSIFSLHSLGLSALLPFIAAILALSAFVSIYVFGISKKAMEKMGYPEDERNFEKGVAKCEELWKNFRRSPSEELKRELLSEIFKLESLAKKLNKSLDYYEWYNAYKRGEIR